MYTQKVNSHKTITHFIAYSEYCVLSVSASHPLPGRDSADVHAKQGCVKGGKGVDPQNTLS